MNKRASARKLEHTPTQLFSFDTNRLSLRKSRHSKSVGGREERYITAAPIKMTCLITFLALTFVTPLYAVSKYVIYKLYSKLTLSKMKLHSERILIA